MLALITGANGQLATDLAAECAAHGDEVRAFDRAQFDITDRAQVARVLRDAQPDVVYNCAAWTAVDACESDPDRAHLVNSTAVGSIAEVCADIDAHLVQVSTDYVFDGTKPGAYLETDPTNPSSVYGQSKLAGEVAAGEAATTVRTSWVCSAHGGNMVATILRVIQTNDTLSFVDDQRGRPTFTPDLAAALRCLAVERKAGIFHVANHGTVSWFEFAQTVLSAAGLDPARVLPISTADLDPPRPAPRPTNSELSTAKYESLGLTTLAHFTKPLAESVRAYL